MVELGAPSAPPLLLVHGLGGNLRNLTSRLAPLLAKDYRVLAVDRPGSGYSPRVPNTDFLTLQTALLSELLDSRGIAEVVVVGHSLGGAVTLSLAELRPDVVRGVLLITPVIVRQDVPGVFRSLVIQGAAVRAILGWTLAIPISALRRATFVAEFFRPEPVTADFGTSGGGYLALRPDAFIETSDELVQLLDAEATPAWSLDRAIPVSALFGAEDAVLDPKIQSEGLRRLVPWATIEVLPGAGHMAPVTRAEVCAAAVNAVAGRVLAGP